MPWPVHPNGLLGAQGGDNDSYRIERSLRFNSADSAYLARTTSASFTSQRIFTFSFWCKRSTLSSAQSIFDRNQASNTNQFAVGFNANDTFGIAARTSGTTTVSLNLTTSAVFRDTSAWYHFMISVDNTQAALGDRGKIYVNGVLQSLGTQTATQNVDYHLLTGLTYDIGRTAITNSQYFNGYFAEFHFIDGQALTPSSFGETDAVTGRWKAKAYSGTYGTNGFYLKFADNSSTAALGTDSSGNGNTWTTNNFSVTAGADNDSLVDSPTNYGIDTGVGGEVRGNYCTINPLKTNSSITISDGNLKTVKSAASNNLVEFGSVGVNTGKWYWEMKPTSIGGFYYIGIGKDAAPNNTYPNANDVFTYGNNGNKYNAASEVAYGSSFTANDVIGIALDCNSGTLVFYKNNTSQGTAFSSGISGNTWFPYTFPDGTNNSHTTEWNFGQRPFVYTAPTGFEALCTTNLTTPTIKKPSSYFDAVTYTGTGASNSISSLGFSPDLVWIKNRGGATSHAIYDTTRGTQAQLSSDTTGDQVTSSSGLTAFGSNGFTISTSTLVNTTGTQYVAWAWDQSTQDGFTISTYTGNGANRTISHTLGVAPKMLIVKARTTAGADQGWPVWHTSIANTTYLTLSTTSATATGTDYWNSTSPTSSVFSVGTNVAVNANADTYIAYLFAEVEGFSKIGSYIGNGSADGPFVWCGFRPRWILIKDASTSVTNWAMHDTARSSFNLAQSILFSNFSDAEVSGQNEIDILSNGFKIRRASQSVNTASATTIFAAFAESPFKYARAR